MGFFLLFPCVKLMMFGLCVHFLQLELEDVGSLKKIRIWHDGKGQRPSWLLDTVSVASTCFFFVVLASSVYFRLCSKI